MIFACYGASCRAGITEHASRIERLEEAIREDEKEIVELTREETQLQKCRDSREAFLLSGSVPEDMRQIT